MDLAARFGLIAVLAVAAHGCVVAEFDRVRQASQARAQCDVDTSDDESSERCEAARDASLDAMEEEDAAATLPADGGSAESDSASDGTYPSDASNDASMSLLPDDAGMSALDAGQPDGGAALMCLDTFADPKNCGQCGNDCAAPHADVACQNKTCVRACQEGWGDCNFNLQLGAAKDGCELPLGADPNNCGGCKRRCVPPDYGFATCKAQLCTGHRLVQGTRATGELYGNATGGAPFDMQCPDGQVITGIEGIGDTVAYGLKARCAALKVARSGTSSSVSTVAPASYTLSVGGNISGGPPAYQRLCPEGQVVSALGGSLWIYPGSGVNAKVVKTLSITCAALLLEGDKLSVVPKSDLTIGELEPTPVAFKTACPAGAVIGGFSGRAGAYVDGIAALCGPVQLREQPAGSVMVASD